MEFNDYANPKVEVKRFKIYADVGTSALSPTWELQGRGVTSWSVQMNQDVSKESDVLGFVDIERGIAQPTQEGVTISIRKDSQFGEMLFEAWFSGDMKKLDNVKMLQKFEFVDAETVGHCLARLQDECVIAINSFNGEADGYLNFEIDIHYSNVITTGHMAKEDGSTITFIED